MERDVHVDEPADTPAITPEPFHVHDEATANWLIRKIVETRAYANRAKLWADAEIRRAQRDEAFLLQRFGKQLEDWARLQIAAQHDRRKSVALPAGVVGFRTEPRRLAVTDEQSLLAWCHQHLPSAIRVVESPLKTPLMDHLTTTGEIPNGVEIAGGNERFYVQSKKSDFVEGEQDAVAE